MLFRSEAPSRAAHGSELVLSEAAAACLLAACCLLLAAAAAAAAAATAAAAAATAVLIVTWRWRLVCIGALFFSYVGCLLAAVRAVVSDEV